MTGGRLGALAPHGASCLTGGIPLVVDGEVVGAIGTSGETPDEDEGIPIAGAAASLSVAEVPALTYEGARLAAEAAGAEAARRGVAPVVYAVDGGGALVFLVRPDLAQVTGVDVTTAASAFAYGVAWRRRRPGGAHRETPPVTLQPSSCARSPRARAARRPRLASR